MINLYLGCCKQSHTHLFFILSFYFHWIYTHPIVKFLDNVVIPYNFLKNLYFVCMNVLYVCIYGYHIYPWCLKRTKEGVGYPRTEVTGG